MPAIHNTFPVLEPGDVVIVHGRGVFSTLIRFFERWLPDKYPRTGFGASHVAGVSSRQILIEAVWWIRLAPISEYSGFPVVIYRNSKLNLGQRIKLAEKMVSCWGQIYGWSKIGLLMLDSVFHTYWFTQRFGVTSFKVCSEFYAWAYQQVTGLPMIPTEDWRSVAPSVTDDYCRSNPAEWVEIYRSPGEWDGAKYRWHSNLS